MQMMMMMMMMNNQQQGGQMNPMQMMQMMQMMNNQQPSQQQQTGQMSPMQMMNNQQQQTSKQHYQMTTTQSPSSEIPVASSSYQQPPEKQQPNNSYLSKAKKDQASSASSSSIASDSSFAKLAARHKQAAASLITTKEKAKSMSAQVALVRQQLERKYRGLDLVFLLDVTGSMSPWIDICREKLFSIVEYAKEIQENTVLRVGFIGYRDYEPSCTQRKPNHFEVFQFVDETNIASLTKQIAKVKAIGGNDFPEDVAGGLSEVLKLKWEASTRLVIHIADAPAHGTKYCDSNDNFPDGDPNGLDPEKLLEEFCKFKIDYYFCRVGEAKWTQKMTNAFQKVYEKNPSRNYAVYDVKNDTSAFLPSVIKSVQSSVRAAAAVRPASDGMDAVIAESSSTAVFWAKPTDRD